MVARNPPGLTTMCPVPSDLAHEGGDIEREETKTRKRQRKERRARDIAKEATSSRNK